MDAARILIVDDELSLRRLMRLYLVKAGFAVEEASTGPQALAALRRGHIDLAIVDVMLPEVDGFEVVRRARRNSSIPIILLTARGEEASRVAGLEIGADDYVVKPFLAHEVVARVRAQLRRARGFEDDADVAAGARPRGQRVDGAFVGQEVHLQPEAGAGRRHQVQDRVRAGVRASRAPAGQ